MKLEFELCQDIPSDVIAVVAVGTVDAGQSSVVAQKALVQVVSCMERNLKRQQNWQNVVWMSGTGMH